LPSLGSKRDENKADEDVKAVDPELLLLLRLLLVVIFDDIGVVLLPAAAPIEMVMPAGAVPVPGENAYTP
jgi:hypothetical protein